MPPASVMHSFSGRDNIPPLHSILRFIRGDDPAVVAPLILPKGGFLWII